METGAEAGRVQLSSTSAELVRGSLHPDIGLTSRGEIDVKGKVSCPAWCFISLINICWTRHTSIDASAATGPNIP